MKMSHSGQRTEPLLKNISRTLETDFRASSAILESK